MIDILKPWPVSYFDEKVPGGWGIMLDDVAGGIMANFLLQAYNAYFHHAGWVEELINLIAGK